MTTTNATPLPRFTLSPSVSLPSIVSRLPLTYTGADFYALCSDAMLRAVTRQASRVDARIRDLSARAHEESAASFGSEFSSEVDDTDGGGAGSGRGRLWDGKAKGMDAKDGAGRKKKKNREMTTAQYFDHHATPDDLRILVDESDFLEAHRALVPSVSAVELAHYERVRRSFEGQRNEGSTTANNGGGGAPVASFPAVTVMNPQTLPLAPAPRLAARFRKQQADATTGGATNAPAGLVAGAGPGAAGGVGGGKGKGKAVENDEDDDDADDSYVHGYGGDYEDAEEDARANNNNAKGRGKGKGKGKGKALFREGTANDDEGLY